jgi:hypothetical protein
MEFRAEKEERGGRADWLWIRLHYSKIKRKEHKKQETPACRHTCLSYGRQGIQKEKQGRVLSSHHLLGNFLYFF